MKHADSILGAALLFAALSLFATVAADPPLNAVIGGVLLLWAVMCAALHTREVLRPTEEDDK